MHAILFLATAALTIASADSPERTTTQAEAAAQFTISGVSKDPAQSTLYYKVSSPADLDGDGRSDTGVLRLSCSEDKVTSASYRYHEWRWNNAASATHAGRSSVELGMSWDAASPELQAKKVGYDLKTSTKARAAASSPEGQWSEVTLGDTAGLCADASRATNLNSSKSN